MKYLFLFFIGNLSYSQSDSFARISYQETFGDSDANLYSLYIHNNISLYQQYYAPTEETTVMTIAGFVEPIIPSIYLLNKNLKQIIFQEGIAFKAIQAIENDFSITWNITNDFKKIGDYNCQRATTNLKNNNYSVWYTQDIPLSFGPWKFYGLPGLILEINDETNFYKIIATKVNLGIDHELVMKKMELFKVKTPVNIERYYQLRLQENDDIYNFYQSISPRDTYLKITTDYSGFMREPITVK
jgi:GLPGLI family protein